MLDIQLLDICSCIGLQECWQNIVIFLHIFKASSGLFSIDKISLCTFMNPKPGPHLGLQREEPWTKKAKTMTHVQEARAKKTTGTKLR